MARKGEWICLRCGRVTTSLLQYFKCCGEPEAFDPVKHRDYIVGKSNAWGSVWKRWKDDPVFKEASEDLMRDGCYSSAIHMNEFIERIRGRYEE